MTVEQMKMEWDLQETEYIQLNLDRQHAIMEQIQSGIQNGVC